MYKIIKREQLTRQRSIDLFINIRTSWEIIVHFQTHIISPVRLFSPFIKFKHDFVEHDRSETYKQHSTENNIFVNFRLKNTTFDTIYGQNLDFMTKSFLIQIEWSRF